ncbi:MULTISPECIES: zeta toxin family protein [Nocardiaceae]|uniref:UDP-N-acetylglucosamine kinase n=1 Tax=Rhodococcoides corynebacterioides TaxID=53972 RepID=A0ABS2KWH5_9NOCA|nr:MULTISPECIES: zeta toxin family protein [Rhodococcus]MBM7416257.1 hypothetical protein [Rhodococcus corynebacterioides]MBP1114510.1 hypothetical protein [Rhodococcus sp. PvP016]
MASELDALDDLRTEGARNSAAVYEQDFARRKFRRELITDLLDTDESIECGRSAIVTAGVPGAGKSTMLRARGTDLGGYRFLDADEIKVSLIERALEDGIYDDVLGVRLADGHCVAPMELASLVHRESVNIVEAVREECLRRGENIVVEGTLKWEGQPPDLYGEFSDAGYRRIEVLAVEVEAQTAHNRALTRWWGKRMRWRTGDDRLGGRFTPPASIDSGYDGLGQSKCARHAWTFLDLAKTGQVDLVSVEIMAPTAGSRQWRTLRSEQFARQ